jgi:hypothetical protein
MSTVATKHPRLRRRGAVYWFRCKIPVDLIEHYKGKQEINESLRTKDPNDALRLVRKRSEEQEQEFAASVLVVRSLSCQMSRYRPWLRSICMACCTGMNGHVNKD